MQRLLSIALLLFPLVACDEGTDPDTSGTDSGSSTTDEDGSSTGGSFDDESSTGAEDTGEATSTGFDESSSTSSDEGESSTGSEGESCTQFCFTPIEPPHVTGVECISDKGIVEVKSIPLTGVQPTCVLPEASDAFACGDARPVRGQVMSTLVIMCLDYLAAQGCLPLSTEEGPGSYEICEAVGEDWADTAGEIESYIFHVQEVGYTDGCQTATEMSC